MDLRTAEDISVELYAEMHIRLGGDKKKAQALMENVIKDARSLSYRDYAAQLESEIRTAARNLCNTSTIEDLFKDPELRLRIEDELQRILETSSARFGFELLRVSAAEVVSPEYELLRKQNGDVELQRRGLEFEQRAREIVQKDRMHEFKTEQDLEEYMEQMGHERGVSDETRSQEMALLKMVNRQEIEKKDALFAMAMEMEKTGHEIGKKYKWDDYTREKMKREAEAEAEVARIWLKVREEKERLKLKLKAEELKIYEGKDLQTLITILPEDKREGLLEYNRQMMAKGMSKDEILAVAAKDSPEVAQILLEQAKSKEGFREEEWQERKKLMDEQAARIERIADKAMDATSRAAQGGSTTQNIVK